MSYLTQTLISALRHSYRGSRSLLASDKLPQPPPPPPARLKSSPTLHDQKGTPGGSGEGGNGGGE
eukprot:1322351-Amorphochlora_amoeboformis.AAC.1